MYSMANVARVSGPLGASSRCAVDARLVDSEQPLTVQFPIFHKQLQRHITYGIISAEPFPHVGINSPENVLFDTWTFIRSCFQGVGPVVIVGLMFSVCFPCGCVSVEASSNLSLRTRLTQHFSNVSNFSQRSRRGE